MKYYRARFEGIAPCVMDEYGCVYDLPGWGWLFDIVNVLAKLIIAAGAFLFDIEPSFRFRVVREISEIEFDQVRDWNNEHMKC